MDLNQVCRRKGRERNRELKEEEEKKREREEETGIDVREWLLGSHFYPVTWCALGVELRSSGLCTSDLLAESPHQPMSLILSLCFQ